jgi:hypothetical protein
MSKKITKETKFHYQQDPFKNPRLSMKYTRTVRKIIAITQNNKLIRTKI